MMKNASIKEMIRKQKLDATDRKEIVSTGLSGKLKLCFCLISGGSRKEDVVAEPIN